MKKYLKEFLKEWYFHRDFTWRDVVKEIGESIGLAVCFFLAIPLVYYIGSFVFVLLMPVAFIFFFFSPWQ